MAQALACAELAIMTSPNPDWRGWEGDSRGGGDAGLLLASALGLNRLSSADLSRTLGAAEPGPR